MKKRCIIAIALTTCVIICSILILDSINKNSFPNKYQNILESYLGEYSTEKKANNKDDKIDRLTPDSWYINYEEQSKKNILIYNERSFFTQLQDMYVGNNFLELSKKIDAEDSSLYLRNAFMAIPYTFTSNNCEKSDSEIAKNYFKYYPKSFCINKGYNINQLFIEKDTPLFLIFVCSNKKIANRFIAEIKNVNAIIKISSEANTVDEAEIEMNKIENDPEKYIFVYNGEIIKDGQATMGLNKNYGDDENEYEQGTIIYNFNHYVKKMYS